MPSDIPSDVFTTDFTAIRSRQAVTFTYGGNPYSGIEEERNESDQTVDPGFIRLYEYGIECLRADFSAVTLPNIGDEFSALNGSTFQIITRKFHADQITVHFGLNTVNR